MSIIRVESAFSFSESIQPIALPAASYPPDEDQSALLSGWGSVSTSLIPNYPSILQYVEIPVLSYEGKSLLVL